MKPHIIPAFVLFYACYIAALHGHAQDEPDVDKQLWIQASFNWRLNEKWTFNQDISYQHIYTSPFTTRFFVRPQFNRQITGAFSLHGGAMFFYNFKKENNNSIELRPWLGAKLNWLSFWRLDFSHYLRLEQRFEHTNGIADWKNGFRIRYRIGSDLPINHVSLTDHTLYGILSYEFYAVPFESSGSGKFAFETTNRFDLGLGYWQHIDRRYEIVLVAFEQPGEDQGKFSINNLVLFLKYKKYFNWE
ncbi:MAG: DUF2490 domain-containing protein [Cyclobacteriaceae bacterium]|nr:DUF2490 domain-containing protein [Cyclobacteriaceae bacterium]